uniref:Unannotated protein n=1 Tax=freshwater metagenome TaxID=449393 RepID=A0A6J7PL18_9ZZZZ
MGHTGVPLSTNNCTVSSVMYDAWRMRSTPARTAAAVDSSLRQCAVTGMPRSCAVSHDAFISSSVHTSNSPLRVGTLPVAWILIQSAPYLMWRRVHITISSVLFTTWAYPARPSSGMSLPAVPPTAVSSAWYPVFMRGPSMTPQSIASRTDGPIPHAVSGSMNEVTPARRIFCRFCDVVRADMAASRWKNSSSFDCTSSNVLCRCASMSPGMTVLPVALIRSASAAATTVP